MGCAHPGISYPTHAIHSLAQFPSALSNHILNPLSSPIQHCQLHQQASTQHQPVNNSSLHHTPTHLWHNQQTKTHVRSTRSSSKRTQAQTLVMDDLELDNHIALPIPNRMGCACPGITYPVDGLGPQLSIPNGIRLTPPGIG